MHHRTRRPTGCRTTGLVAAVALMLAVIRTPPVLADPAPSPAPLMPVEVESEVPVPDGVVIDNITNAGRVLPDEEHILAKTYVGGRSQFSTWRLSDGSDLQCITCDVLDEASLGDAFEDGSRLLVTTGSADAGGTGDTQYRVVECAPSLVDCAEKAVLPVRFPRAGLSQGVQNREARVHPDGEHIKWNEVGVADGVKMTIGRLERHESEYEVTSPVVVNPPYSMWGDAQGWVDGGRFYELGDWTNGGRSIKYGTTTTALNYDVWELDLATGARRQVTTDLDYNELYSPSPDGTVAAYSSARGLDRMDVLTQLVRPPFLDAASFAAVGRISLFNNRRCMNEAWLMDSSGQRDGYAGQPVVLEDGWVIRSWSWFADGTRALVFEESGSGGDTPQRRIRILHFPTRSPQPPLPSVDLDDLDLSWAFPYGAYTGLAGRSFVKFVPGPRGGGALMLRLGVFGIGIWFVAYFDYSDDGTRFISGTESVTGSPLASTTWAASLRVRGAHTGFLNGRLTIGAGNQSPFAGDVSSDVDGVSFDHLPVQADCPGVTQPGLVVEDLEVSGSTLTATVRSRVPEDPAAREVAGATVTVTMADTSTATGTTGAQGTVSIDLPSGAGPVVDVEAGAGSFRHWTGP